MNHSNFLSKSNGNVLRKGRLHEEGTTPVGGRSAHCARCTDANMQYLDGYTCQGTYSLMDEPQMKPCTSLGGSSCYPRQPRQHRQLDSVRQSRQLSTQRNAVPLMYHPRQSRQSRQCCQAVKLDSPSTVVDSCRHLSTLVDSLDSLDSQGSGFSLRGWL